MKKMKKNREKYEDYIEKVKMFLVSRDKVLEL